MGGKRKSFLKKVGKVNGGAKASCNKLKDGNGRLAVGKDEV